MWALDRRSFSDATTACGSFCVRHLFLLFNILETVGTQIWRSIIDGKHLYLDGQSSPTEPAWPSTYKCSYLLKHIVMRIQRNSMIGPFWLESPWPLRPILPWNPRVSGPFWLKPFKGHGGAADALALRLVFYHSRVTLASHISAEAGNPEIGHQQYMERWIVGLDLTTSDYTSSLDWIRLDEIS